MLASGAGVDELQQLNGRLSSFLDAEEGAGAPCPHAVQRLTCLSGMPCAAASKMIELPPYMLEVSSPGVSNSLTSDLDFTSFKGFDVEVTTS